MWGRRVLPATLPAPFSATVSPALSVYLCGNVGPWGLLVLGLPAPFIPHSASLGPATATQVLSAPVPVSAPPTGLDVCFFISLVSDPLAVRFSISSGCVRRRSVSTYAAILVLSHHYFLWFAKNCYKSARNKWDIWFQYENSGGIHTFSPCRGVFNYIYYWFQPPITFFM